MPAVYPAGQAALGSGMRTHKGAAAGTLGAQICVAGQVFDKRGAPQNQVLCAQEVTGSGRGAPELVHCTSVSALTLNALTVASAGVRSVQGFAAVSVPKLEPMVVQLVPLDQVSTR